MRGISKRRQWTIALVVAGTVGGAGVALGAYAFGGAKTSGLPSVQATPVAHVAVQRVQTRQLTMGTSARPKVNRTTGFEGELSLHDGLVKLEVQRVFGLASNSQTSLQLLGRKSLLAVGPSVQILDSRGARIPLSLADDAIARVYGRLLPAASWRWSDDELRPVISVRRIVILRLDPDFGD